MSLKSLNVEIVLDGKKIKIKNPILLDDSVQIIKEKLFLDNDYSQVPELINLQIFDYKQDKYISIINLNDLIYEYYNIFDDKPVLYIKNLLKDDVLDDKFTLLFDDNSLNLYLDDLRNDGYFQLDIEDLQFCLKIKEQNRYEEDINKYVNKKNNERTSLMNKYSDNLLIEFNNISTNKNIDLGNYKLTINDISIKIKGENVETGVKGIFIKLNEIFNSFQLSEEIPFIALSKRSSNTKSPQIKVYNEILNIISDKEVKSWVLNEKKKLNQVTYKIIKGLLIKSRLENSKTYTSINIMQNGEIYVDVYFSKDETTYVDNSFDNIYNIILENVNKVIVNLNTFSGVFLQSKKINLIKKSICKMDSIDCSIKTDFFIDRKKLSNLLNSDSIRDNILEKKDTQSIDILSAYYKKFHNRDNGENDIKGITINIRDNPYIKESSIINIYSADNLDQSIIIYSNIFILYVMSLSINKKGIFQDKVSERRLRELSQKKILGKEGIDFDSKKCQSIRQPKINHDNLDSLDDSYILTYKNKDYRCDNPKYAFPGFTDSDIVCCFQVNQKGNKNYVRNVDKDALTVDIEPSNFKIKISNKNKTFETIVIRIASEYRVGLNEDNSIPRYYYLENDKGSDRPVLKPITNKKYIKTIEKEENIWLDITKLHKIIYPSSKSECGFKPNLNNTGSNYLIDDPCNEHEDRPYFGYNNKSIPCCFDKKRPEHLSTKNKKNTTTNQYILKSDTKILNPDKLGYLPIELINLFNEIEPDYKNLFYRQGVIKDDISSFLYVLLLSVDNRINDKKISNCNELKKLIYEYLYKNTKEFEKLNNGDLLLKYINIDLYMKSYDKIVNWYESIEILEKIIKKNIIIIDIKEKTKDSKDVDLRVLCRPKVFNVKNLDRGFVILLKRGKYFELLIRVTKPSDLSNNYSVDKKYFNADDDIIKFILAYYKDSCIKKNYYPDNYGEQLDTGYVPYIELLPLNDIKEKLSSIEGELGGIRYQIENAFHKVNLLMTSKGVLIPIFETGIISNIKVVSLSSLLKQTNKLLNLDTYISIFDIMNKDDKFNIKIIGLAESNYEGVGGLLTNFGVFIPYLISNQETNNNINKLSYKYYIDADNYINNNAKDENEFDKYSIYKNNENDKIFDIKKKLGVMFMNNEHLKNIIYKIILDSNIDKGDKVDKILKYIKSEKSLEEFVNYDNNTVLLKNIINDMLNDNKENLILNNIIVSDNFNKDEIIVRDSESVLLNINDIREWVKRYED